MLVPATMKPPSPAVSVVDDARTSPLLAEVVYICKDVVVGVVSPVAASAPDVVPVTSAPLLFTVPAVMTPAIVPVQAAPKGQHATCPAVSALQTALDMQQRLGAPRLLQERKLLGQPFDCRFKSSCAVSFCSVWEEARS